MKLNEQLKHCVSIDVETTHLDPSLGSIISVGACFFDTDDEFYQENYIRNYAEVDEVALKINGSNYGDLLARKGKGYATEYEVLQNLIEFCKNKLNGEANVIIGKNPKFDYNFLLEIWKRNGGSERDFYFSYRVINWGDWIIYKMLESGEKIPLQGVSSGDASRFLNIPEETKPHNALTGALYNKSCVRKILNF